MDNLKLHIEPTRVNLKVLESSGRARFIEGTLAGNIDMDTYEFKGKIYGIELIKDTQKDKIEEVIDILKTLI